MNGSERDNARADAAIFVLALLTRAVHLAFFARTPLFDGPVVDAYAYALDAQALAGHGALEGGFYRPPLYGYLRAGLLRLSMHGPWPLGVLQAIAGACTAVLIARIAYALAATGDERLRRRAVLAAGVIAALYGPLVIYDIEQQPIAWVVLLVACSLWLTASAQRAVPGLHDVLAGACLGLATIGWPPACLLAVPCLALRLAHVASNRGRIALTFAGALALAPVASAAHNATHGAPGVVVSGNLGINLWLGNNPRWRDTIKARPGIDYDLEYQRATRAGALTLPERERHYLGLVADELATRPLDALQRTAEKLYLLAHGRELRRSEDIAWLRSSSPIAALLTWEHGVMFPFGLLLPLALFCPAAALRPRTKPIVLLGVLGYALAIALFLPAARYRLPVVVALIPLGAVTLVCAAKGLSRARWVAFAVVVALLNAPNAYSASFAATPAERLLMLAQAHAHRGDRREALALTSEAVQRFPNDAGALIEHGQLLLARGEAAEAARYFARAITLVPESDGARMLHARAVLQR